MLDFETYFNRFPQEVQDSLVSCLQDPRWHPEGSVHQHIKNIWNRIHEQYGEDKFLLLVALFHDLGKPETRSERVFEDGTVRVSHIGHEIKSLDFISKYIHLFHDLLGVDPEDELAYVAEVAKLRNVVYYHMRSHQYLAFTLKKPEKRKAFESLNEFDILIKFAKVDREPRDGE